MPPASLLAILREEIRSTPAGAIPFHRFMELCLYHPQHGYYNSARTKLGAAGDFYTAAHVAPVFARLLARHLEHCWDEWGKPARFDFVELGPGDGTLAEELLSWVSARYPEMFSSLRYTGVEQSPRFRDRLSARLQRFAPQARILADLPGGKGQEEISSAFQGLLFANEFFDALPVHRLVWRPGGWREFFVGLDGEKLRWEEREPSSPVLAEEAESAFPPDLPPAERPDEREDGWQAELCPLASRWVKRIAGTLLWGEALIVDYGYTWKEWQQGRFPQGSALGYRRHGVVEDLLANPGDQDLTAHVNFSGLIAAAKQAGLRAGELQPFGSFLLELGRKDEFQELFADCASEAERQHRARLLKTLLLPQGMGEAFRVLTLEKPQD